MIISLDNLQAGINWWLTKTNWTGEFVNNEYWEVYDLRRSGVSERWWEETLKRLAAWKALRPIKPEMISVRGAAFVPVIAKQYDRIRRLSAYEP